MGIFGMMGQLGDLGVVGFLGFLGLFGFLGVLVVDVVFVCLVICDKLCVGICFINNCCKKLKILIKKVQILNKGSIIFVKVVSVI